MLGRQGASSEYASPLVEQLSDPLCPSGDGSAEIDVCQALAYFEGKDVFQSRVHLPLEKIRKEVMAELDESYAAELDAHLARLRRLLERNIVTE